MRQGGRVTKKERLRDGEGAGARAIETERREREGERGRDYNPISVSHVPDLKGNTCDDLLSCPT